VNILHISPHHLTDVAAAVADAYQTASVTRLTRLHVFCKYIHRVGQKSKLLILSEYVDKTEKAGLRPRAIRSTSVSYLFINF